MTERRRGRGKREEGRGKREKEKGGRERKEENRCQRICKRRTGHTVDVATKGCSTKNEKNFLKESCASLRVYPTVQLSTF